MENWPIPNIRHLRAFREVAYCGSISKAAERIHLSQPAITQALAKLEENLGTDLFERRSDGVALNSFGETFLARVDKALVLLSDGTKDAAKAGRRPTGRGAAGFDHLLTARQLKALTAVSKAKNFTLAARISGVSQPTVHRAARDLERLSGLSLFKKTVNGIELTPPARILVQAVKLCFAELYQGFTEVGAQLGGDLGEISIGTLPLPRTFLLPTAINSMLLEHPNVKLGIIDGPYNDLLYGLRHGDIDFLVGALREPQPIDDIIQEALFDDLLAVVGHKGHPLAKRRKVGVQDLAGYPWVVPRPGTPTRAHFDRLFEASDKHLSIVETSSLVLVRGLLRNSDRLTLISAHQVRPELDLGLLEILPVDMSRTARPIGITYRKDWRPTAIQIAFLEALRQAGKLSAM